MHEDLCSVGAVDNRSVGQRHVTDQAQQILQEHRVNTHDTVNVLAILRFPQGCDTLRVAGPIRRIGIARVVQVAVVAEQRLILFVDALDCLILAESNAGNKLANRHLAVGDRNQALRTAEAAAGTNLDVVHGVHKVVARLAVGAEHLGKDGGDLLRRINRAVEGGKAILCFIDQLGHLGNMSIANALDLLVGALEHLRAIGERIGDRLQRRHIDCPILEQLAGRCLSEIIGHGDQRAARNIGQSIDHGADGVNVAAIHWNERSHRPHRARGLLLHAAAELIDLLRFVRQRRKIARRDLVLKATDDLDGFLCLALHGFCRVKQHETIHAKRDKNHRDDSGDDGCNAAILALALAMAMANQAVRGRARRRIAAVVQAKIVIFFFRARALKLGTVIIQAGERASLGGARIDSAQVTRKPCVSSRRSTLGGIGRVDGAGVAGAMSVVSGASGTGDILTARWRRTDPSRRRRRARPTRKCLPAYATSLFCLLRLFVQSGKHRRFARRRTVASAVLAGSTRYASVSNPI